MSRLRSRRTTRTWLRLSASRRRTPTVPTKTPTTCSPTSTMPMTTTMTPRFAPRSTPAFGEGPSPDAPDPHAPFRPSFDELLTGGRLDRLAALRAERPDLHPVSGRRIALRPRRLHRRDPRHRVIRTAAGHGPRRAMLSEPPTARTSTLFLIDGELPSRVVPHADRRQLGGQHHQARRRGDPVHRRLRRATG